MFSGSPNIIIQGGTFIVVGNTDSASLEEMGVNISQNSSVESNHKPYRNPSQEANGLESCKPRVDSAPAGSHSGTSVYTTSGHVPEYRPNLIPTLSITSEVKSCQIMSTPTSVKSVGASSKPNDGSHAPLFNPQSLAISQSHNTVRTRTRVIQLVLSLIILSLAHRHRLLATIIGHPQIPTPTSVKSVAASRRNAKPNNDSHALLHSQSLVSQSHNTMRMYSRSNVLSLIILNLAHRHRLLTTILHALTHSNTFFPLSDPSNNLWRTLLKSVNYLSNLLRPSQTGLRN